MLKLQSIFIVMLAALCMRGNELEELLERAMKNSPTLQHYRHLVEKAHFAQDEVMEFLDPSTYVNGGYSEDMRDLPVNPTGYSSILPDDAFELNGGVMLPLACGAYLSGGAATRRYIDNDAYDHLYQNLLGLQISVPLLKDRGFAVFKLRQRVALAEYNCKAAELVSASQDLHHKIELGYIKVYEALSNCHVQHEATERFRKLVDEAKELVRLKSIPEYQLFDTMRELQIGMDDEEAAQNAYRLALVELAALAGETEAFSPVGKPDELVQVCQYLHDVPQVALEDAMQCRGDATAINCRMDAAQANAERYAEEEKESVSLNMGLTYQADNDGHLAKAYRYATDDYWGTEVTVTWNHVIGNRGTKARQAQYLAEVKSQKALLEQTRVSVNSQLLQASIAYHSALKRLEIVRQGIKSAQENVKAELERFQMGDGASNLVLDAQKNLTNILQRLTTASADLLRARADLRYASGYFVERQVRNGIEKQ